MAQLPALTIQKFASLTSDLLSERKPPIHLITSPGGLVFSHPQDQVIILRWSPLFSMVFKKDPAPVHQNSGNYEYVVLTLRQTMGALTGWLVPIVACIVLCTLQHMHSLLVPDPCFLALQGNCSFFDIHFGGGFLRLTITGLCRKQPDLRSSGRHTKLPPEEIRTNFSMCAFP